MLRGTLTKSFLITLLSLVPLSALAASSTPLVTSVDLQNYSGKWFEIARIENEFQIGCRGTTATYAPEVDSKNQPILSVSNDCWVGDDSQRRIKSAHGRAWPEKNSSNTKLKISFVHFGFWWKMFANDYWVLDLGPVNESGQYAWALVGHPKRRYAWIMSRTPKMDTTQLEDIFAKAVAFGYQRKDFRMTDQAMNIQ